MIGKHQSAGWTRKKPHIVGEGKHHQTTLFSIQKTEEERSEKTGLDD